MSQEVLVNVAAEETRVALVENGQLQELYIERARNGLVGNIYKGKVCRVLPGMQAAFLEVGLERTAFLHASDIRRSPLTGADDPGEIRQDDIRELLHDGQELLVQVVKDPLGTKGARLTTYISIPSRYLVFLPQGQGIGVSAKIEDDNERARLKTSVQQFTDMHPDFPACGYIVRTAGEGAPVEALHADMLFLHRLWETIIADGKTAKFGQLVHGDLPLVLRVLRDLLGTHVERVRLDSEEAEARVRQFTDMFVPELSSCIELFSMDRPIFDLYNVEDEINKALNRKVPLKSGGYLIIDQTEAMTTIDVNTGAYVGHRNLEDTVFKTNLEAAEGIGRQLRLRNLGGIIILDFIDMREPEHRAQVMRALQKVFAKDYAKTHICDFSPLGLIEMTRKRTRESLEQVLTTDCPSCEGLGSVKTAETVCYEIFREISRSARQFEADQLLVLAAQEVIDMLLDELSAGLADREAQIGIPIRLQVEALYGPDQFDVVLT